MTPEERAQQTLENWACSEQLHFDEKEFWEDRMNHDPRETFLLNVAAQIRQAENAALERAAQLVDDKHYIGDHHDEMCRAIQETAVEDFVISAIGDIRALRHKEG